MKPLGIKRLGNETLRTPGLSQHQYAVAKDAVRNCHAIAARPKLAAETEMILRYAILHAPKIENAGACNDCDRELNPFGDCDYCALMYGRNRS